MKQITKLVILIIITVTVIWFFQNKEPASKENPADKENQEDKSAVLVSTGTISQTDNLYDIKADYPQFANIGTVFNQKITDFISNKIDAFKRDADENWEARNATLLPEEYFSVNPQEPFNFITDWKPAQVNGEYISFIITIYYFTGGAHGINEVYAFNYDVVNKKEITISDFLNSSGENFKKLSDLAIQESLLYLKSNVGSVDESMEAWVKDGAGPEWENYKDFNFKDNAMIIYFQQYQVAAGAVGPVTITLPKDLLIQHSVISNYLQ